MSSPFQFVPTPHKEGDPGKLKYLHDPNYQPKLQSQVSNIDPRVCPGCLFPHAMRKHEHVNDSRCKLWMAHEHLPYNEGAA